MSERAPTSATSPGLPPSPKVGRPAEFEEPRTVRVPVMVTAADKELLDEMAAQFKSTDPKRGSVSSVIYMAIRWLLYGEKE